MKNESSKTANEIGLPPFEVFSRHQDNNEPIIKITVFPFCLVAIFWLVIMQHFCRPKCEEIVVKWGQVESPVLDLRFLKRKSSVHEMRRFLSRTSAWMEHETQTIRLWVSTPIQNYWTNGQITVYCKLGSSITQIISVPFWEETPYFLSFGITSLEAKGNCRNPAFCSILNGSKNGFRMSMERFSGCLLFMEVVSY